MRKNSLNIYVGGDLTSYLTKHTNINSKWKRSKIIKLVKKDIKENFHHPVVGRDFFDKTQTSP